jgi:hypothetical protein
MFVVGGGSVPILKIGRGAHGYILFLHKIEGILEGNGCVRSHVLLLFISWIKNISGWPPYI